MTCKRRHRHKRSFPLLLWMLLAAAHPAEGHKQSGLRWTSCGVDECALLPVPLRWDTGAGQIDLVLRRRLALQSPEAQLWILPGGPGLAGARTMGPLFSLIQQYLPTTDLYTLDPRGTGGSAAFDCDSPEASCSDTLPVRSADAMKHYGFTANSHDLAAYIKAASDDGQRQFILARSSGTFWAQRFLVLYPDLVDGMILESYVPPNFNTTTTMEATEAALSGLLEHCWSEPECSHRLDLSRSEIARLWTRLENGHCTRLEVSVADIQESLIEMLSVRSRQGLVPATLALLRRCSPLDVRLLTTLLRLPPNPLDRHVVSSFSTAIFQGVSASELWEPAKQTQRTTLGPMRVSGPPHDVLEKKLARWPRYFDALDGVWPGTELPLLIMHGSLDPRIPSAAARGATQHYRRPTQHFVEFALGGHLLVGMTPSAGEDCALRLLERFVGAPDNARLPHCAKQTDPPDFEHGPWPSPDRASTVNAGITK